jgi:hypothetical protein
MLAGVGQMMIPWFVSIETSFRGTPHDPEVSKLIAARYRVVVDHSYTRCPPRNHIVDKGDERIRLGTICHHSSAMLHVVNNNAVALCA